MAGLHSFLPILGLVLFVFGFLGALIIRSFGQWLVLAHLLLGAFFLLLWAGFKLRSSKRSNLQEADGGGMPAMGRRGDAKRFLTAAQCLLFLGFVICGNWLASRYDWRWDLTETGEHSLAKQSVQLIENLSRPLRLAAIGSPLTVKKNRADELLRLYGRYNPAMVKIEFADPRSNPHYVEQDLKMKSGDLIYMQYGEGAAKKIARLKRVDEETLSGALMRLVKGRVRKVYYVLGHDQPDITGQEDDRLSSFAAALEEDSFRLSGIALAAEESFPADASLVVLASPRKELSPREKDKIREYLRQGGGLLMLYDPQSAASIPELCESFGIKIGEGVVLDQVQRAHGSPEIGWQVITNAYGKHPVTRGFSAKDFSAFMIAAPLRISAPQSEKMQCSELVLSGPKSWGETDLRTLFGRQSLAVFEPEVDWPGPAPLAVACQEIGKGEGAEPGRRASRVAVFGDSDWIKNANFNLYSNRDLIMNTVNWLAGDESGITRRAAAKRNSMAAVSQRAFSLVLAASFLLPELILLIGLFICWKRRHIEG